MAILRPSLLLLVTGCAVAADAPVHMELAGWSLEATKISASYQPAHVVVLGAVLTQGSDSIRADRAEATALEVKDSTWVLTGNVRVQVPQGELAADTATISFRDNRVAVASAHGKPATFLQHTAAGVPAASGHAQDISIDVAKGEVHLNGEAWVTREHNDLNACQIVYNITQQTVDAQKCDNADEGVHGTIELKQPPAGTHK